MVKAVHCRGRIAGLRKHRSSGKCWRKREGAPASHSNRSLDSPQRPGRFPASGGSEPAGERPSFRVTGRVTRAAGPSQPARRPRRRKARLEHAAAARWTRDRRRRCRTESPRRPGFCPGRRWARGYHDSGCHSGPARAVGLAPSRAAVAPAAVADSESDFQRLVTVTAGSWRRSVTEKLSRT